MGPGLNCQSFTTRSPFVAMSLPCLVAGRDSIRRARSLFPRPPTPLILPGGTDCTGTPVARFAVHGIKPSCSRSRLQEAGNAAEQPGVVRKRAPPDVGMPVSFPRGQTMVARSRRIPAALTLACGLSAMLAIAQPGLAAADEAEGAPSEGAQPCIIGHRFAPGPIVDGHNRQPTRAEFEARTRELRALVESSSCSAPLLSSTAGHLASDTRPDSANTTPEH